MLTTSSTTDGVTASDFAQSPNRAARQHRQDSIVDEVLEILAGIIE